MKENKTIEKANRDLNHVSLIFSLAVVDPLEESFQLRRIEIGKMKFCSET